MPEEMVKCKGCGKSFPTEQADSAGLCPKCHQEMVDTLNEE